ncbi:hypothetical protein CBF23_007515 [Marinomonas agarivorans]|nr:hypothetical protein CBF23_007515 [Marinomonas agarivorans]
MDLRSYSIALLLTLSGGLFTTGISYFNGYSPCQIFGFCQSDLIEENTKLLAEVERLRADIEKINHELDEKITKLNTDLEQEKAFNESILSIIKDIGKINQNGETTSDSIRQIAQKIVDIAHLLNQSSQ